MEEFFQQWQFPQFELYWDPQWFLQLDVILFGLAAVLLIVLFLVLSFARANDPRWPLDKQYFLVKGRLFFLPAPKSGHFIVRSYHQGIWARPYGSNYQFIPFIWLVAVIEPRKLFNLLDLVPDSYKGKVIDLALDPEEQKKGVNVYGLVKAKDGEEIPAGQVMTEMPFTIEQLKDGEAFMRNGGEKGYQLALLSPGEVVINEELFEVTPLFPVELYAMEREDPRTGEKIPAWPRFAIITMNIGRYPEEGTQVVESPDNIDGLSHKNFTDLLAFEALGGIRGTQLAIAEHGSWFWHPTAVKPDIQFALRIRVGEVAVLLSSLGSEPDNTQYKVVALKINGKVVKPGTPHAPEDIVIELYVLNPGVENVRGVLRRTPGPGMHSFNFTAWEPHIVDTTPVAIAWNGKDEKGGKEFVPINVTTSDGFTLTLMPELTYQVLCAPEMVVTTRGQRELELEILNPQGAGIILEVVTRHTLDDFLFRRRAMESDILNQLEQILEIYYVDIQNLRISEVVYGPEALEYIRLLTAVKTAQQEKLAIEAQTETAKANVLLQYQVAVAQLQYIVADADLRSQAVEKVALAIKEKGGALEDLVKGMAGEGGLVKAIQMFLSDPAALTKLVEAFPAVLGILTGMAPKQLGSGEQSDSQTPPPNQSNPPRR